MSGVNTLFDGQFCRKPLQNLGGKTEPNLTRDAVLERAQAERLQREKARQQATAIVIIQANVRGFLARKQVARVFRSEYYDTAKNDNCSLLDKQGEQISRLLMFFPPKPWSDNDTVLQDVTSFANHAKHLSSYKNELWQKCFTDSLWDFRMHRFIRCALRWQSNETFHKNRIDMHRNITFFLEWFHKAIEGSEQCLPFFVRVWMDCLTNDDFFTVNLKNYSSLLAVKEEGFSRKSESLYQRDLQDLLTVLQLPFLLIQKLINVKASFVLDARIAAGDRYRHRRRFRITKSAANIVSGIFSDFTCSICNEIMQKDAQNFAAENMLRLLAPRFPLRAWVSYLTNDPEVASKILVPEDYYHTHIRHLLYIILIMIPPLDFPEYHNDLITLVGQHIAAIDNQYAPWLDVKSIGLEEEDEEEEEEMETDPDQADNQIFFDRNNERLTIVKMLVEHWPHLQLGDWISPTPNPKCKREMISIISCFIRTDPKKAAVSFPFLATLAFNREYIRKLYEELRETGMRQNVHSAIGFIWLLTYLMNTLHDGEFLASIPLDRDELGGLIVELVSTYSDLLMIGHQSKDYNLNMSWMWIMTRCLQLLYDRNTRLHIFQEDIFVSSSLKSFCPIHTHDITFDSFREATSRKRLLYPFSREFVLLEVLHEFPFAISFHDRIAVWHGMIEAEKVDRFTPYVALEVVQIRRSMLYEDTYDKLSFENVPDMKNPIRISLVNAVGLLEAGVDGGGLLREFLTEATKAGVDPNRGLFRLDTQNRIYPNPIAKKIIPDHHKHYFLIGRLVGKALYEQTLLELPLAGFFIQKCITGKVNLAVDYLATLDPALHRHLLSLKNFTGDFNALGLDFTVTSNDLGETETINLKENGSSIMVDKDNVIEYIHLVADYKINREIEEECNFFRRGLVSVVPIFKIFSWREMQTLVSGSDKPIDIEDWRRYTNYTSGYAGDHPCIKLFWEVVESLDEEHLRKLLKFVTSCSRPPLLGFKDLVPNFGIQNAGNVDRLPTAATCMNLLKLPEFEDARALREKLIYAIDAQAGFELS